MEEFRTQSEQTLRHLRDELARIHTGRPSPGLVDELTIDYQGATLPIKQVASVTVPDATSLVIAAWDRTNLARIEQAIRDSSTGLSPVNNGEVVRVSVPPLSEERRREYMRLVDTRVEAAKVAVRNVRQETLQRLRRTWDADKTSEDTRRREEDTLAKAVTAATSEIDNIGAAKKRELEAG